MQLNLVKENKVKTEDTNLAKKVHSPDVWSLKGKSARLKLVSVADSIAQILDKLISTNEELKLPADELLVNSLSFQLLLCVTYFIG